GGGWWGGTGWGGVGGFGGGGKRGGGFRGRRGGAPRRSEWKARGGGPWPSAAQLRSSRRQGLVPLSISHARSCAVMALSSGGSSNARQNGCHLGETCFTSTAA